MKIRVRLPSPMEAELDTEVTDFSIEPIFYRANGKPMFLYLDVCDAKGSVVGEYALSISGASGQVALMARKAVTASYDAALLTQTEESDN